MSQAYPRAVVRPPLRIAIDYTTGAYPGAGVARYTRSLVEALTRVDRYNHYTLFYGGRGLDRTTEAYAHLAALVQGRPNVQVQELAWTPRQLTILWQRLLLPWPVDRVIGPHDVIHAPDFIGPPHRQGRSIVTIHDLSFLVVPEYADPKLVAYLKGAVPRAVRRANRVVAVSETTRQDLIRLLGVRPDHVVTVPNGIDPMFQPLPDYVVAPQGASLRLRLHLPPRFILHVGTLEPRKNLVRLIDAYYMLVAAGRAYDHYLVLAGRKGWLYEPIFARVQQLGLQQHVFFLDYVAEADLPLLYNMATVFAYPSLYEGFGLPVGEAMACGVPTLTSRVGATGEIAGDSALLVDPLDTSSIATGLEMLLERPDARAHFRDLGQRRVQAYTWEAAAGQMLGLFEQ